MLNLDNFNFYYTKNKVIATATYRGKTIKGIAKCDPRDAYHGDIGKTLAAARCQMKLAKKRAANARKKVAEAERWYADAQNYLNKMNNYLQYAQMNVNLALEDLKDITEEVGS